VWRLISESNEAFVAGRDWRQTTPPVIGVLKDYFWENSSDEMRRVTDAALEKLQAHGAQLMEVPLPAGWSDVHVCHRRIMAVECAQYHAASVAAHPEAYLPRISALMGEGRAASVKDYETALEFQRLFRTHLCADFLHVDVLLAPGASTTAPNIDTTGDPRFQSPWSLAGTPTVCFPSGLASDGLPCALQLIAPHGLTLADEIDALRIGAWCEEALGVDVIPPGLS
jgi:Asp-tRNA(Asn)/Glu-tRNA(Gln) amidotransferase A subunit family amidase